MEKLQIIDKVKFFQGLSSAEKEAVSRIQLRIFKVEPRVTIIREREMESSLFILIRGTATVVSPRKEPVAILKPGEVFGEVSFLGGLPRTASVVANNEVIVMRVDKDAFQILDPALREKLKDNLIRIVLERLYAKVPGAGGLEASFDWCRD